MKYPLSLAFLLSFISLSGQHAVQEINEQVWKPFIRSFSNFDTEAFMSLHSPDVVRLDVEGGNSSDFDTYRARQESGDIRSREQGWRRSIDLRFEYRAVRDSFAYETGYYRTSSWSAEDTVARHYYGKFNVILKKTEGRWKILLDADHGGVAEAEFWAAESLNDPPAPAQGKGIWIMDFFKIKPGRRAEALFFFEQNWMIFREEALRLRHISDYRLLEMSGESEAPFNLILMTEYPDSASFHASEANFAPILRALRPDGPVMMNDLKREDIFESRFSGEGTAIFAPGGPLSRQVPSAARAETIIRANIEAFSRHLMAGDLDAVAAAYTEDTKLFPPQRDILHGNAAARSYWEESLKRSRITFHKVTPEEIRVNGTEAYDWGYYEGKSIGPDGKETAWKGKYVILWKEMAPGVWKIYADIWNRMGG
jgi:ketosteroid isomerase-like protein